MKFGYRHLSILIFTLATILFIPKVFWQLSRKPSWITIRAIISADKYSNDGQISLYYWRSSSLKIGDEEKSPSGKIIAKLQNYESFQDGPKNITVVDVSVFATLNPITNRYSFKNQDLLIGNNIDLDLGKNHLSAQVLDVNVQPRKIKIIRVEGIMSWQKPWFVDAIKVGDVFVNKSDLRQVVKIINKQVVHPQEKVYTGPIDLGNSYLFRDIKLTLELSVDKNGSDYYFSYIQPLKVGNTIYIPMEKYNLYNFVVTKMDEID